MDSTHDIVVVGDGPAGCALALTIRQQAPQLGVVMLGRENNRPGSHSKPGETLPPQCRVLLERLGLWDDFLREGHLPAFGAKSAWGGAEPAANEFLKTVQRQGWHLDRNRFDAFLQAQCKMVGIPILDSNLAKSLKGKVTVDATGRAASIGRKHGADVVRFDRLCAIMTIVDAPSILDRDTLVEAVEDGWWYSALLPDQRMAIAFFTDTENVNALGLNSPDIWKSKLSFATLTASRFTKSSSECQLHTYPAHSQQLQSVIGDDWIAVGDAAAAFDPLSSQGIFFALRSGMLGAYACIDLLSGAEKAREAKAKYTQVQRDQYLDYWETRREYYAMEQRWPNSPFWASRQGRVVLPPDAHLQVQQDGIKKPRMIRPSEWVMLAEEFPHGGQAHQWLSQLRKIRPDLPTSHALEVLQYLKEDGLVDLHSNPIAV